MAVSTTISFNDATLFYFDSTKIDMSGGLATLKSPYSVLNPMITMLNSIGMSAISGFSEVDSISGSDAVQYIVNIGGLDYYWNGAAWALSDASYAKSNIAADINANCGHASMTALISTGKAVLFKAFLHSAAGTTTPTLTSIKVTYTFFGVKPSDPPMTTVYVWLKDILDATIGSVQNAQFSVENVKTYLYGSFVVLPFHKSVAFDVNGYAAITLMETTTPGTPMVFGITYQQGKTTKQIKFSPALIPNNGSAALTSFTMPADSEHLGIQPLTVAGPPGPPGLPPYVDIAPTAFTVVNNQATPLALTGLIFNKLTTRTALIDMWIYRYTTGIGATSLMEHKQVLATYRQDTDTWDLTYLFSGPDDSGITLSPDSTGQIYYVSSNITGTASVSKGLFQARTFAA